jgi:hypothetical protein
MNNAHHDYQTSNSQKKRHFSFVGITSNEIERISLKKKSPSFFFAIIVSFSLLLIDVNKQTQTIRYHEALSLDKFYPNK